MRGGGGGSDYEPYTYNTRGHGTCTCDGSRLETLEG